VDTVGAALGVAVVRDPNHDEADAHHDEAEAAGDHDDDYRPSDHHDHGLAGRGSRSAVHGHAATELDRLERLTLGCAGADAVGSCRAARDASGDRANTGARYSDRWLSRVRRLLR
jgi:hypothetical protein